MLSASPLSKSRVNAFNSGLSIIENRFTHVEDATSLDPGHCFPNALSCSQTPSGIQISSNKR
jgi:hypothetical protein